MLNFLEDTVRETKPASSHLKMDGWKESMNFLFGALGLFSEALFDIGDYTIQLYGDYNKPI